MMEIFIALIRYGSNCTLYSIVVIKPCAWKEAVIAHRLRPVGVVVDVFNCFVCGADVPPSVYVGETINHNFLVKHRLQFTVYCLYASLRLWTAIYNRYFPL